MIGDAAFDTPYGAKPAHVRDVACLARPGRNRARARHDEYQSARVRRWRRHRAEVLAQALDSLDDGDRRALAAALAPLRRLTENMEGTAS